MGTLITLLIIFLAYKYFKPRIDINEEKQIIFHFWWRGSRITYVL